MMNTLFGSACVELALPNRVGQSTISYKPFDAEHLGKNCQETEP